MRRNLLALLFFFNDTATTEIYTLSLHDALPILHERARPPHVIRRELRAGLIRRAAVVRHARSEEHTSELQSHVNLVCRLLLEKKKKKKEPNHTNTQTSWRSMTTSRASRPRAWPS